jgi:hypothetical protein
MKKLIEIINLSNRSHNITYPKNKRPRQELNLQPTA